MKKIIIKHILLLFLFVTILFFLWFLFLYEFFNNELKKTVYPSIHNSKQILAELVTKDFAEDKVESFFEDFKKSKDIFNLSVSNNDKKFYYLNNLQCKETLLSFFKFSYPVKKDGIIVGRIKICPSYNLINKVVFNNNLLIAFFASTMVVLLILVLASYAYVTKYIIYPFEQMTKIINGISSESNSEIKALLPEKGMWKDLFSDLKKLNTKVIDISTTMKLLFSATSVITSDLELTHSIHLIFNIIQRKIDNSLCALFMPSEDGQLKIVAKSGFSLQEIKSISMNANSPIFQCYKKCESVTIHDVSLLPRDIYDVLSDENIVMQMNIPLIDENHNCIGVLSINLKNNNCLDNDTDDTITIVCRYLSALIIHVQDYKRVKDANRKLETEIQMTSKELIQTNAMLIKKIRDIKAISDISAYASAKFDMEDITKYIIEKTKEILSVETAGIFMYSAVKNEFISISGSFGIYDIIKAKNADKNIFNKIVLNKKSFIVQDREELKISCPELLEKVNVNSAIFSPSKADDKVPAVIVAVNKIGLDFNESDIKVLEHVSIVFLGIIEKIELYSKMKADFTK
ncbi:MAG: GAF domain-containing protein [Endomicrobiaceae bacterium]